MLNWKVVTQSLASFTAISFVLCVGYGLLAPARFHPSWLLEAVLPGFKWLSVGSFILGVIESGLYGAWAGLLYTALYNYFARRANRDAKHLGAASPLRTLLSWVIAIVVLTALVADAEPILSRQDRRGGVTVTATLMSPATTDEPLRVKVVLDTHSVSLDDLAFEKIATLRKPDGSDVAPVAIEDVKGSGHHREAVLVFGTRRGPVLIVVKDVGGVAERSFSWDLPAAR